MCDSFSRISYLSSLPHIHPIKILSFAITWCHRLEDVCLSKASSHYHD
jgi:hypothetical protein